MNKRRLASLPVVMTAVTGMVAAIGLLGPTPLVHAETLPVPTGEKAQLTGGITPVGDVDLFGLDLLPGDRVTVKVTDAGPLRDLNSTLRLLDPTGSPIAVTVDKQGTRKPSFSYTADAAGAHVVELTGDPGGFSGAEGNYTITTKIKRVKAGKATFEDAAGGDFVIPIGVTEGAQLDVKLSAKKGGLDVTGLFRPDGSAEADFIASLKLKNRTKAQSKKFKLTGGFGIYELRGRYDAGAKLKVKVKVRHDKSARKTRLSDDEPRVDPFIAPFPGRGIGGTILTVIGFNFASNGSGEGAEILPRFWLGGIEIPNDVIEHPFGSSFSFPVPEGLAVGEAHDLEVRNPDGQGDAFRDVFFIVPPPSVAGLNIDEAGPAGGRRLRILGTDLGGVSVVLFDGRIVQPTLVLPNRVDVVAPAHAPGEVTVVVRDEQFQTSTSPQKLTYLDIGSNAISSVAPSSLQGIGGQTITVTGVDFTADSALTLDGVPLETTLVNATTITFVAPAHAGGTFDLRVADQYEQSDEESLDINAFTDGSTTSIPAPTSGEGMVESWRTTRILRGELTGDGVEDLVLLRSAAAFGSDAQQSRVRILAGNGSGGFTDATSGLPSVSATDDWRARDAVLADVDGRNGLDIVLITTDELDGGARSGVRVLLNDGDGNFTDDTSDAMPSATTWGDRNQGRAILAVDVDNDLDLDLVIAHDGFFQETVDISPPPPDPLPDPPPDPVLETRYYAGTRVLLNDGNGVFTRDDAALPAVDIDSVQRFEAVSLAATDVDGDDYIDIFLTSGSVVEDPDNEGTFLRRGILLLNDRAGAFDDVSDSRLPAVSGADYLQGDVAQFVDYDADGDLDLVVLSDTRLVSPATGSVSTSSALRIYPRDSDGNFGRLSAGTLPAADELDSSQCESAAFGDLTGDGRPEIFLVSSRAPNTGDRAGRVLVWAGRKFIRGSEGLPRPTTGDDGRGTSTLFFDVDDDGDLDVILGRDQTDESVRNTRVFVNPRIRE